ncbi:urea amidolyase associated protein UAAP1 [uncultured Sphingomonas sp.]|uniref:urea amidolyase associated protein UAAP1 n=1 Tax=uncultured Sphingomonas sp. TaxID=158754 RepID=UPI0035C98D25
MTVGTADPKAARDHARAQGGTRADAMPVLPPVADDAPDGLVWEETIAPGGYASRRIARGTRIRLVDLGGDACVSTLLFNAETPTERLNVADTIKVQWNGHLTAGRLLLSDMGRVMASILEDGAGTHDAFCGASTQASNARNYGDGDNYGRHPSARDRLMLGVAKHGLGRKDVHPCVNWFKGVRVAEDGATEPVVGPFDPGRALVLRAEMKLIVVLANCPHVLDPRPDYTVTPLRITAWAGEPAAEDDAVRTAAPESLRAFLNTEDLYRR